MDGLHQHPSRSFPENAEQRIIFDNPTWSRQTKNNTLFHGVSFQMVISSITKDTPPNYAYTKLSSSPGVGGEWVKDGQGEETKKEEIE